MISIYNFFNQNELKNKNFSKLNCVQFSRPIKIGSFVVKKNDFKRELIDNQEDYFLQYNYNQLTKYYGIDLKVNLEQKFDNDKEIFKLNGDLEVLLKYILINRDKFIHKKSDYESNLNNQSLFNRQLSELSLDSKRKLDYDFVAVRALFALLLRCQYVTWEKFIIRAEKFDNTIYLQLDRDYNENYIEYLYAENKFKILATRVFNEQFKDINQNNAGDTNDNDNKLDNEFVNKLIKQSKHDLCFVYSSKIGTNYKEFSLLYSASMCCFEDEFDLNKNPLNSNQIDAIELKINREINRSNRSAADNFKSKKMIKYWSKGVLTNVKKIIVGFWSGENLQLNRIEEFSLNKLRRNGWFNQSVCFYQLNQILNFIKECFESNQTKNLLKFEYKSHSKMIICTESDTQIIPDFFKAELLKN